ncbi:sensor histidine kinase [Roseisalinus antarcticus]|uniref:sensor histidine kinase n=1 Tax=Roseisalinus antarcticus TaxID=254357 RepID=UPI0013562C92|nr:sensor histidine kinase [Roseisalinus antarcticus]
MAEVDEIAGAPDTPVLVFAPLGDDAVAIAKIVEASGLTALCVPDAPALISRLDGGGAEGYLFLVISHEGAELEVGETLCTVHESEPMWSRLPVMFLVNDVLNLPPACRILSECTAAANYICLQRPAGPFVLTQLFGTSNENRKRQFQSRDLMDRLSAEEKRSAFLLEELQHRVRNSLAVLQSLFKLTLRSADSVADLDEAFSARLRNLSEAYSRLSDREGRSPGLRTILSDHVAPYAASTAQYRLDGDPVELSEKVTFDLAMTVHELATNAAKYGALSTSGGQVSISWRRLPDDGNLEILWQERGGPPVSEPKVQGLGSSLIANFRAGGGPAPEISFERGGRGVASGARVKRADLAGDVLTPIVWVHLGGRARARKKGVRRPPFPS